MATCNLARGSRSATLSIPGQNTYVVEYKAEVDSKEWGAKKVVETCQLLTAPNDPLPLIHSTYDVGDGYEDEGAFCLSLSLSRETGNQTVWNIVANYGPLPPGRQVGDEVSNPILRPIKYWLEFETITEQVTEAWNVTALPNRLADTLGPVVNAAGREFDETLFQEVSQVVLVAQQNYATLQDIYDINATFDRTLNNDTFFGRPKGHAAFRGIECGLIQSENGTTYYTGTIRVLLSRTPLTRKVVNQGWSYFEAAGDTELIEAVDKNGERVSEPVLLATNGTKLPDNQVGNMIEYRTKPYVNYSGLGI